MQVFVEDWSAGYGSPYLVMADDSANTVGAELVEDGPDLRAQSVVGSVASSLAFI